MKKLISILLCIAVILSLTSFAFAAELNAETKSEDILWSKVQTRVDDTMDRVRSQCIHLDPNTEGLFQDYFFDLFKRQSMKEYGSADTKGIEPVIPMYDLPNGGVATYVVYRNGETYQMAVTMLDRDRTLDFILENSKFTVADVIESALGYIPYVGGVLSSLFTITSWCNKQVMADIKNANGYTKITNCARVFPVAGAENSFVEGWHEHTRFYQPENANNFDINYFPAYQAN